MSGADFLDTNVFVYAFQFNDREKQRVARELVEAAVAGKFVISVQVLSEFASTLLHKASPLATPEAVIAILDDLSPSGLSPPMASSSAAPSKHARLMDSTSMTA